ncbi:phosphoribosylpyrophosphate synthetase [Flavisolibacter ginsenosidimutans]|uniref:Phosphoribosylpyrophosphate synthetase n=1 Tax=Flavisolibacter ginsenosidimutans TaxID=661481 RepID=A0A5B8UEE6_9BACT|nr:phosphoribosylpyrophosphate synthetase [Flavisolibacter ginsenosidimutans]QEC54725.1 phosphoribosylpyrophosphate synthetase [Flavisolibacter ginsenosidimutans]
MYQYTSPSHAIDDLRKRGFTTDFNLDENCLVCGEQQFNADQFEIHEVYRFEGASDPGDESVVYGIESNNGVKGVLVDGYGYSSSPKNAAIIQKLKIHANN